jgi:opacity protein-like surface antigen
MRTTWMQRAFLIIGLAALASLAAHAQTDVAASLYGAFTGTTTGNIVSQSPANAAGGLLEVRHIAHPWFGYEGTYAYNRANQNYSFSALPLQTPCPTSGCSITTGTVSANAHEVTGDYVASVKVANFRPFAVLGGGLLLDVPSSGQETTIITCGVCALSGTTTSSISTSTTTKPVFVYGAGLDWGLLPHIGLRLQYRGNLYKAPDLTKIFTSTNAFTHTAEPMIGVYFRL